MSKILFTENKLQNLVRECVNEVLYEFVIEQMNESDGDNLNENMSNESLGNFLGSAYQWFRNKYYNFKNDFEAGRRYQREKNKDYDPYSKYGSDAERFRNLGGQEYADYRYNLAKDRNQKADLDWENQFGTTTTSWKKPSANPDLADNQTEKPKQTAKPKQQTKKNKTNSKNK